MKFENISFLYGSKVIFSDFSLSLPDTGLTAVSGPSGCGKTTLLRLLAGLEKPDKGSIIAPPAAEISFLFQENRLLKSLPAAKQIEVVCEIVKKCADKKGYGAGIPTDKGGGDVTDVADITDVTDVTDVSDASDVSAGMSSRSCSLYWLRAVGLEHDADTLPEAMSGGMQRRLSLARCLAYGMDKSLLILDEPFTGVDPARISQIMEFIRALKKPVIYTGHDETSLAFADSRVTI